MSEMKAEKSQKVLEKINQEHEFQIGAEHGERAQSQKLEQHIKDLENNPDITIDQLKYLKEQIRQSTRGEKVRTG